MLCSVQTSKSGSNWLDRLWSNKGFNNSNDDDLSVPNPSSSPITDASNSVINSNSESTHSESDQNKVTATTTTEISSSDSKDLLFLMNNVLSDLFNMGGGSDPIEGSSRHSRKKEKIPRKQTKPKFCFVSGNNSSNDSLDCVRKDQNALVATGSLNSDKNSNNVDCGVDDEEEEDVEEEKEKGFGVSGDKELKGYSRSEVTVIDTSCQVWKFDKMVFRKKNVWKVRDKKGKSWVFGSKKRKVIDLESANGNGAKKKAKVSNLEVGSSEDANDVRKAEDERREEVEMAEDHSQVATKRIHLSRSPDKSKKSGSSVILITAIPTSNKRGRNITKNRLKDAHK
ncbi:FANTOM PROTEIN [Salix viminalis]|uniref:FANTOM PROTEIN n=1 Tax=Salix viminalis TaxID=40686 RepID=A0A9Q0SHP9_SALVM|nr:FANTOM PROTEIN [Salix viminalis]